MWVARRYQNSRLWASESCYDILWETYLPGLGIRVACPVLEAVDMYEREEISCCFMQKPALRTNWRSNSFGCSWPSRSEKCHSSAWRTAWEAGASTIHIDSLPHCSGERKPALPSDPTPVWLKTEEKSRKKVASDLEIGRQRGSSNLGSPQPGEPETGWQRDSRREHLVLTIDWIPCPWGSFCSVLGRGNSLDERYEDMK